MKHQPIGTGMVPTRDQLGRYIRKGRIREGLTQVELARRAHLSQTAIAQLECGRRKATSRQLSALASTKLYSLEVLVEKATPKCEEWKPRYLLGKVIKKYALKHGCTRETLAEFLRVTDTCVDELFKKSQLNAEDILHLYPLGIPMHVLRVFLNSKEQARVRVKSALGVLLGCGRVGRGFSMSTAATTLGISREAVNAHELGVYVPRDSLLVQYAVTYGLSIRTLLALAKLYRLPLAARSIHAGGRPQCES